MIDYTLKFPDQATANEVLFEKFPLKLDEDLNVVETYDVPHFPGMSIDTIGVIYKPTGEMLLGEDGEYPAMSPIVGWHVNLRVNEDIAEVNSESDAVTESNAVQELTLSEKLQALAPYIVQVNTPARVWA